MSHARCSAVRLPLAGAVAGLLAGCPLVQVEAQIEEVCIARTGIVVEPAANRRVTVVRTSIADLAAVNDLLDPADLVTFRRFVARPTSGPTSLAFLESAQIVIAPADPTSPLPPTPAFSCSASCVAADGAFTAPAASDANVVEYLQLPELAFELTLTGTLPAQRWTLDAEVCMAAKLTRTVSP